jgi:DNA polymerase-3 subunit alpha
MSDFVHLHVHSEYSPLDAPVRLDNLVPYAKELGFKSLAITDHGTVSGWVKFAKLCKKNGIKAIFGLEGYFAPDASQKHVREDYHILLLAKTNEGIKNIFRLSEKAYTEGFYYVPRMDWKMLEQYHEGVICTSACVGGIIPEMLAAGKDDLARQYAERFRQIFGSDFYLELQYHGLDFETQTYGKVAALAAQLGIKTVGTNDVHYLKKEDHNVQEALVALNTKRCIRDPDRMSQEMNQFYLKSPAEMVEVFGGQDRMCVQSTLEIADSCVAVLEAGKAQLPPIEIPKEFPSELAYLEHLAREGMVRIGKAGDKAYEARFEEELGVVRKLKEKGRHFDRYFLIVHDYVAAARRMGISVGQGRGSGAGSLLLYCMGITGMDPIRYELLFERFLDEDRNEMPDVDIDFQQNRREELIQYLRDKYGKNRCSKIGTFNSFHVASALKGGYRVFDPGETFEKGRKAKETAKYSADAQKHRQSQREVKEDRDETVAMANEVSKLLPKSPAGVPSDKCTLHKEVAEKDKDRIYVYDKVPQFRDLRARYPEIFEFAEGLEDVVSTRGIHASGIVLTYDPLVDLCPQQRTGEGGELATAFDMDDLEWLGCIKFDILGTKCLTVIRQAVDMVKERHGSLKNGSGKTVDIDRLDDDDPTVLSMFTRGDTLAIFQFEGDGITKAILDIKPDCFEDLIAINALYRPGPMQYIGDFARRKSGRDKPSFPTENLKPILKNTFGIMVYQEQVIKITRVLAGFTGSEADKVRKAMGKKKKDVLDAMKPKFLEGCEKLGSCSSQVAAKIWSDMEEFSRYAFNKAHACSYSMEAYRCAFLKTYYPAEWMAAQLTVEAWDSEHETVKKYETGARKMGINILKPDVNKSKTQYVVEVSGDKPAIRTGLKGILGVGVAAADAIVKNQPYRDMYDFCMKAGDGAKSNVAQALAKAGAFDWMKPIIAKKLGKEPSKIGLAEIGREYADKADRVSKAKKLPEARKEEKRGIGDMFEDDNSFRLET